MTYDINAAIAAAAAKGPDMTVAQKGGGGDYQPPAEGTCRLRLIGYVELGKHEEDFQGVKKVKEKVDLIFEISGPKWPKQENGELARITIHESLSLNEKANFFKLFTAMNYDKTARHFAQLVGKEFIGVISHKPTKRNPEKKYATLRDPNSGAYTVRSPIYMDPVSGQEVRLSADPQVSPTRLFLWDFADKAMFDSLFIDGEYEERKDEKTGEVIPGRSKNVFQNTIRAALNWRGSPAHLAISGGDALNDVAQTDEVPPTGDAPWEGAVGASPDATTGAAADPLAGLS